MSEILYSGKTLDEIYEHAMGCAQWPGSGMQIRCLLIERIRKLEKALEKIKAIDENETTEPSEGSPYDLSDLLLEAGDVARKALRGEE